MHRSDLAPTVTRPRAQTPTFALSRSPSPQNRAMPSAASFSHASAQTGNEQCVHELLDDVAAPRSPCLSLLPKIRDSVAIAQYAWDDFDLRVDVPLRTEGTLLINPSILCYRGRLLLAARAIEEVSVQPPCTDVWRSHSIFTSVAYDAQTKTISLASAPPLHRNRTVPPRHSCVADITLVAQEAALRQRSRLELNGTSGARSQARASDDGNAQASRCARLGLPPSVGLGMEDPRLFESFSKANTSVAAGLVMSYSAPKRQAVTDCAALTNQRAVMLLPLRPLTPPAQLHWEAAAHASDRNWLLFQRGRATYSIFSIEPHIVLQCSRSGRCEERHRTYNRHLDRRFRAHAIHGGANPLLARHAYGGHGSQFVSIFHTKSTALEYDNYVYTFSATPPFQVLSLARNPLTLRGQRVRFVTSLTFLGRHPGLGEGLFGISYGSDDREGRFAILPLRLLLQDMQDVSQDTQTTSGIATTNDDNATTSGLGKHLQLPFEASSPNLGAAQLSGQHQTTVGLISDDPGQCFMLSETRFDAPSIKKVKATAPGHCCAACREAKYCTAFSWSSADGGVCWLKQWSGTAVPRSGFVSGHFGRHASCGCDMRHNAAIGLSANDSVIAQMPAASPSGCCAACVKHERCGAWTWTQARRARIFAARTATGGVSSGGGGGCELYRYQSKAAVPASQGFEHAPGSTSAIVTLKRSVLFVHNHPPQQRLGSDRRLLALLQQVQRLGWHVTYAGADDFDPGPVRGRKLLAQLGIPFLTEVTSGDSLVTFARAHDASVVVLCLWFWGQATVPTRFLRALRTKLPQLKIVVMSDDVHHLRLQLEAADEGRVAGKEVTQVKDEELRTYFYADHVLAISADDKVGSLPTAACLGLTSR